MRQSARPEHFGYPAPFECRFDKFAYAPNRQSRSVTIAGRGRRARSADLLPDVLDVDQGRDGADLGVLRAL